MTSSSINVAIIASSGRASPPESGIARRSGSFPPSTWDNCKSPLSTNDVAVMAAKNERHERLKKEIKSLLKVKVTPLEKVELVDSLQQFGIRYHFEEEIQQTLESVFNEANTLFSYADDLYSTALLFKVLRENGYNVSSDVFKKYICPKVGLISYSEDHEADIKGILGLYEASFLGFECEEILDIARGLATKHLKELVGSMKMESNLKHQVMYSLTTPTYWRSMRVQARLFIDFHAKETTVNPILMEFAKLDYNKLQELHKNEIEEIIKWWQNLSLGDELSFARDKIVESYIWTVGILYQPEHGDARKYVTKAVSLLTIIDDMYDVYGSINEVEMFTRAIERWDVNAIEELPKYMSICFLALFNMVHESTYHILKEKNIFVAPYIKKLWETLCKAYLVEARWYHDGHKPKLEEYIKNGIISSGVQLGLSYVYIFSIQNISEADLNFLQMSPNVINWCAKIFRLNNDMSTSMNELKRGDVLKAVECYQQERNISRKEAELHIQSIIMDTWKKINKEKSSAPHQIDIIHWCIQTCRTSHCFYHKGDGYGSPAKDQVMSILFDSV